MLQWIYHTVVLLGIYILKLSIERRRSEGKLSKSSHVFSKPPRRCNWAQSLHCYELCCPESVWPAAATPVGATRPITASVSLALLTSATTTVCPSTPTKTKRAKTASGGSELDRSLWGYRRLPTQPGSELNCPVTVPSTLFTSSSSWTLLPFCSLV